MKAISVKQPWAWLVVSGLKLVEFRSRSDSFRGRCYIHASKKIDKTAFLWIRSHIPKSYIEKFMVNGLPDPGMFITGKLIGMVNVVDCMTIYQAREKYYSKVGPAEYDLWIISAGDDLGNRVFILENPFQFDPDACIPCRGKLFPLFFDPELE